MGAGNKLNFARSFQHVGVIGNSNGYDVTEQVAIRIALENVNPSNEIIIEANIQGESAWHEIGTITGATTESYDLDNYDNVRFRCTTFDSPDLGNLIVAGFFKRPVGGNAQIGCPNGDAIVKGKPINLTSSDGSITITGDDTNNIINLQAVASGGTLGSLGDVTLVTPLDNQALIYETASGEWKNEALVASIITNDSAVSGATTKDALETLNSRTLETQYKTESFTLTGTDITNKYVILANAPATKETTRLTVIGGSEQFYSLDFEVTVDDGGKRLSWNGLNLEAILTTSDILVVIHN